MACANPYEWTQQSNEHRIHAMGYYPFIAKLVALAGSYQDFITRIKALSPRKKSHYIREYQAWYRDYGKTWNRLGCLPEYSLGEHTDKYSFSTKPPTTRPYLGREGLSGLTLGAISDRPPLPSGYVWCSGPAAHITTHFGGTPISTEKPVTGFSGWTYQIIAGGDDKLYYRFRDSLTNADLWACPRPVHTVSIVAEVKLIQAALLRAGFNPGAIDGLWGPKTCQAAFSYQRNKLGETGSILTPKFFYTLGVHSLASKYARSCDKWYTGELGPDPDFVPAATPLAVKKALLSLGYNPGPMTNVWDREVCRASFAFKKAILGENDAVLGKSFFEKLGLAGTLDLRECEKFHPSAVVPKPKPVEVATAAEDEVVAAVVAEQKAGFGWIALMLGAGVVGTVIYRKLKKK